MGVETNNFVGVAGRKLTLDKRSDQENHQTPIERPQSSVNLPQAISFALQHPFDFKHRSSRSEYWWFYFVFNATVIGYLFVIQPVANSVHWGLSAILSLVFILGFIWCGFATFSLSVRRLHDINKSGWWFLLYFIPFAGLLFLAFTLMGSNPYTNNYPRHNWKQ